MPSNKKFSRQAFGLIALLVVQYLLGMLSNLYVHFPEHNTNYQQWDFAKSQLLLMSHIVLGLLLFLGALALLIGAVRAQDKVWKIAAGLGMGSIILAIMSGSEFVSTQTEAYSLAMSAFFITAVASYVWGLYETAKNTRV